MPKKLAVSHSTNHYTHTAYGMMYVQKCLKGKGMLHKMSHFYLRCEGHYSGCTAEYTVNLKCVGQPYLEPSFSQKVSQKGLCRPSLSDKGQHTSRPVL